MQVESLGYRTDLMLRRLAGASVDDRGDYIVVRTPDNPTFYWGNFLLLRRAPAAGEAAVRLEDFAREFPDAGHVAIGIDGTDGKPGDVADLLAAGLELETSVVLTAAQVGPPEPPPDVEVRALRTDADWQQVVDVRLAVDDDHRPEHVQFVQRKAAEFRRLVAEGHGRHFGAVVDGVVRASLGIFSDGSGVARYQNVETDPSFRRRGLASVLLRAAAQVARDDLGASQLVIVADPEYVAIDLYRGLGFTDSERQVQLQRAL
jgi:GNAT superfamily N-acetyltransferase